MNKTDVTINKNERSWAIELISLINSIADNNDLVIKRAGGEVQFLLESEEGCSPT